MFGAFKIGVIRGIPIRLHFTLVAVVVLLVFRFGLMGIPAGILLFGSVLLHELGHSVVAQSYSIRILSIDLHVLGGMALLAEPPRTAKQEIWVAAAGPAVSAALALAFFGLSALFGARMELAAPSLVDMLAFGAVVNMGMALFNLVPALPMDGGRIFRAALSMRLGALRATRIAAHVSRGFGVLFIAFGVIWQVWSLAIIGGLLFLMVANEERVAMVQEQLRNQGPDAGFGFGPFRMPEGLSPRPGGSTVIDVTGGRVQETREEFVDALGRRYVVVTKHDR